jgi:hypothetical protein
MVFPWSVVLLNAPLIADAAQKLWARLVKKQAAADDGPVLKDQLASQTQTLAAIGTRLDAIESRATSLESAVLEASKLLDSLAQQNLRLVEGAEALRRRLRIVEWSGIALVVAALALWALQRSTS